MTLELLGKDRISVPGLHRRFDGDFFRLAAVRCFNENRNPFVGALGNALSSMMPTLLVVRKDGTR